MKRPRGRTRHLAALVIAVSAIVLLYQATTFDTRHAAQQAGESASKTVPVPGARLKFEATAYCQGDVTASGVPPQRGVAAADPDILPVGSVVEVSNVPPYSGIYTIMDTGPMIQGRRLDIYIWSCFEALDFGRRQVDITVLRLGWDPRASSPGMTDRKTSPAAPLPSRVLQQSPPAQPPR